MNKIQKSHNFWKSTKQLIRTWTFIRSKIGFGSYSEAEKLKQDVEIDFPEWRAKIVFDSPTYRVRVGRFKTKLEAERRFIEVREKYPQSIVINDKKREPIKRESKD